MINNWCIPYQETKSEVDEKTSITQATLSSSPTSFYCKQHWKVFMPTWECREKARDILAKSGLHNKTEKEGN
jgi:hypothetical protein